MSLHGGRRSFPKLLFEVVLIAVGVFLALWANNWHEDHEHRAQAKATLRNFAGEMEDNRQATESNRSYHETLSRELVQFLRSNYPPNQERFGKAVLFLVARPV